MDDEVNEKINYSLCCLSKSYEGWGAHKRTRLSGLLKFSDLSNEMRKELLEDSLFDHSFSDDYSLYALHRQNYGTYWKASHRCQHPEHTCPTSINKVKVKDIRKVAIEQYGFINSKYPKRFPLFGNLCRKHRSIHRDINIDEIIDKCWTLCAWWTWSFIFHCRWC